jgi:GntR family transcriptional regulator, trigonelline degradation regulator
VSRTVVREALRQLEADGLVTIIPNRGPVVATLTRDDAAQLYEAREALEALAGRLFTLRATPEQLDGLQESLAAIEVAFAREDDPAGWIKAKDDFYELLLEGSGNAAVAGLLRTIQYRVRLLRGVSLAHPGRRAESARELRSVVDAIADRDGDRVEDLLKQHVQNAGAAAFDELAAADEELASSVH